MVMGEYSAICSAEAGLQIKMYGCAVQSWPGRSELELNCASTLTPTPAPNTKRNGMVTPRRLRRRQHQPWYDVAGTGIQEAIL